jgi:hypothetical protein
MTALTIMNSPLDKRIQQIIRTKIFSRHTISYIIKIIIFSKHISTFLSNSTHPFITITKLKKVPSSFIAANVTGTNASPLPLDTNNQTPVHPYWTGQAHWLINTFPEPTNQHSPTSTDAISTRAHI